MVFEELCLNMYHHMITEGYTMGNSSLVQQVLLYYLSRYGGTFTKKCEMRKQIKFFTFAKVPPYLDM